MRRLPNSKLVRTRELVPKWVFGSRDAYRTDQYARLMKNTLSLIVLTVSIPLALMAGKGASTATPAVTVSCTACTADQSLIITGTGFKSRSRIQIEIEGPVSYSITATADSNGNIAVDFGATLCYNPGSYVVYASVVSGKGAILAAVSEPFTVE